MQGELFHETIYDAIGATIETIGGYKKVAAWLFPDKPLGTAYAHLKACLFPDKPLGTAYAHLKACLRDDKPEKLEAHAVLLIQKAGRDAGVDYIANYTNEFVGYEPPVASKPRDQMAELQQRIADTAGVLQNLTRQFERIQQRMTDAP